MLQHWTNRRKASLIIHSIVVLIPFTFSTGAAALFWHGLFRSWWIAVPITAVIDGLALLGLALFICRVPSPFQWLRHVLPFISVVPLGYEALLLLYAYNDALLSAVIASIVIAVMVYVAHRCFATIEGLFVSPMAAAIELADERAATERQRVVMAAVIARQQMTQQVEALTETLTAMAEQQQLAVSAVQEWSQRPQLTITATQPALPAPDTTLTLNVTRRQVRAYADSQGVSERTVYRQMEKGELTPADILGKER
jgi:hypothetical protein